MFAPKRALVVYFGVWEVKLHHRNRFHLLFHRREYKGDYVSLIVMENYQKIEKIGEGKHPIVLFCTVLVLPRNVLHEDRNSSDIVPPFARDVWSGI